MLPRRRVITFKEAASSLNGEPGEFAGCMFHRHTGSQALCFRGEFPCTLLILNYLISPTVSQPQKAGAGGKSAIGSAVFTNIVCCGAEEFQHCLSTLSIVSR
jgi:hypothetical protein